ncbi:LysR family transcriptional regulator [Paraburkholderia bannensis]|uniref:LysR family transcriptional regulator n=1 Tax=Paraburkholderia bannensis TaxID=765414 RepID=UPI002AAF8806|nr:LysR family transcriptional regulator [Paraburkholderia bannensis]
MDQLTSMRVFIQAVERGSLSAAADSLDMSRAMATRYLEGLEDWLGSRLLHRTTRRLSLTEAGEQAIPQCREMLSIADELKARATLGGDEPSGKLRLTTTLSFAQAQLTAAMIEFQEKHPLVEVDLLVLDRSVNLVEERVDLALRISNRIDEGLVARRLAVCHSVLCASPSYLRRYGRPVLPDDLKNHRCIAHSGGLAPEFQLQREGQSFIVEPKACLTSNETSIVQCAAVAGAGIAMLPTFFVGDLLKRGQLVRVLEDYALAPLDIQAVYLSRRHQSRPLRMLIDFLSTRFGGPVAPWDAELNLTSPVLHSNARRKR